MANLIDIGKGQIIELNNEKYEIVEKLGDGGNGSVWSVKSDSNNIKAMKFLKPDSNPKKRKRFENEANFCKQNGHKNIIKIYDYGTWNSYSVLVMDKHSGTLRKMISQSCYKKKISYILQLCEAVKFLHTKDVIHRDIKPENILISDSGEIVLTDLGIAHFPEISITEKDELLANRNYLAPEQKIKGNSLEISFASDIYAIGILVNELFTGKLPSGNNYAKVGDVYPFLKGIDIIVSRCLLYNPDERPSIDELLLQIMVLSQELETQLENYRNYQIRRFYKERYLDTINDLESTIIETSIEDLLFIQQIYNNETANEIKHYNSNYHSQIHFTINKELEKLLFISKAHEICKEKFYYESHSKYEVSENTRLKLTDPSDKLEFERFNSILREHQTKQVHQNIYSETLHYYSLCLNYHREEILDDIGTIKNSIADLKDAPIVYIVQTIKETLNPKLLNLSDFNIGSLIYINWEKTLQSLDNNRDVDKLIKDLNESSLYSEKYASILYNKDLMDKFKHLYNIVYIRIADTKYRLFVQREKYELFCETCKSGDNQSSINKEDLDDFLFIEEEYGDFFELSEISEFNVRTIVAKLLDVERSKSTT